MRSDHRITETQMKLTRRRAITIGAGVSFTLAAPFSAGAAVDKLTQELITAFTGGAEMDDRGVTLTAPEIAENGNTVPVSVDAPGAVEIILLAPDNPLPPVAAFRFGPLSGSRSASTRIRLASTQEIIAIARMADGGYAKASRLVKVTIGGCGG